MLVARERQVEPGQYAGRLELVQLVLVEIVGRTALVAEEQPVLARRARSPALLEEGAERGDPRPGPNHDHRRVTRVGELEPVRGVHEHPDLAAGRDPLGQERRGDSLAQPVAPGVADHGDCQVYLARMRPG